MTDVIDVDEAVATDISTPGLRRRRRATAPTSGAAATCRRARTTRLYAR